MTVRPLAAAAAFAAILGSAAHAQAQQGAVTQPLEDAYAVHRSSRGPLAHVSFVPEAVGKPSRPALTWTTAPVARFAAATALRRQALTPAETDEVAYWVAIVWAYVDEYNEFPGVDFWMKLAKEMSPNVLREVARIIFGGGVSNTNGGAKISLMGGVQRTFPVGANSNMAFFVSGVAGLIRAYETNAFAIRPEVGFVTPVGGFLLRVSGGYEVAFFEGGSSSGLRVTAGVQLPTP